jgi:thioredoxin 1
MKEVFMSEPIVLNSLNFENTVLKSKTPFLVDFWASWCGPCRAVSPIVDEIAAEREGALTVGKLNVDDQPEIAAQYHVMSIPTLILFKDGEPAINFVGAAPKEEILKRFEAYLQESTD